MALRPGERIPLHEHSNRNDGGKLNASSVTGFLDLTTVGGSGSGAGGTVTGTYRLDIGGGKETVYPHGTTGATETIDLANGNYHRLTLDANCTLTFTGATTGTMCNFDAEFTEDGTGGWTPNWPGSVVWANGVTPVHDTTAGSVTIYGFVSTDGGITWYGTSGAGLASTSFVTPAIVLGSAAAAGVATTVIRSDATIVAFDATVPVTQAFGDAAATGSVAKAARRDHKHGMPSAGTSATDANIWRPLMSSGAVVCDGTGQAVMVFGPA